MPRYNFKFFEELAWAGLVAAITFVGTQLAAVDPAGISDWKTWGLALLAGAGRIFVAAVFSAFGGA